MADDDGVFFLDTSTQISKTWEDKKIRHYLNQELSQKPRYCSAYVKNEYKIRVLNDAISAHALIVDSATLDEAKSRLKNFMKLQGKDEDALPYKIFLRFFNQYATKPPFLRKLEKIIEVGWLNFFFGNIKKPLFNLVKCASAQDDPVKKRGYYRSITSKCTSDCKIDDFLRSQHDALKALSNIDVTKLNKTNDSKRTLRKIKSVSTAVLGGASPHGKHCKEMSDAVISIEAKASDPTIILHSMDSDFTLLGEVLGIPTCVHSKHEILKMP